MLCSSSDQGFLFSPLASLLLAGSTMDAASLDAQIEALRLHSLGTREPIGLLRARSGSIDICIFTYIYIYNIYIYTIDIDRWIQR